MGSEGDLYEQVSSVIPTLHPRFLLTSTLGVERRSVSLVGNFVRKRNNKLVRLDGILRHSIVYEYRIFLVVSYLQGQHEKGKDKVMVVGSVYQMSDYVRSIVGSLALRDARECVVERRDGSLVHAPYDNYLV